MTPPLSPAGGGYWCDSTHIAATETPFPEKKFRWHYSCALWISLDQVQSKVIYVWIILREGSDEDLRFKIVRVSNRQLELVRSNRASTASSSASISSVDLCFNLIVILLPY